METLKGLPLVENVAKAVPDAVTSYYQTTFATGTGEFGTFRIQDFLGTSAGIISKQTMLNVVAVISSMNVSALTSLYNTMLLTVQGTYGAAAGPVTIPSGPAAGVYATGDLAFTSGLIPAANTIISTLIATYPLQTTSLNRQFTNICNQYTYEYTNQVRAGVDFTELVSGSQNATFSFMSSLATIGQDSMRGGQANYINVVANPEIQAGQAVIGALREGRNILLMDKA